MLGFIEQVIGEPAFVAGNSLGGFIATHLAAKHPRAVLGLVLMNATPFWAFRDPAVSSTAASAEVQIPAGGGVSVSSPAAGVSDSALAAAAEGERRGSDEEGGGMADWLGWDGTLPAPAGLFRFGAWYFDRMRDPRTVKTMLGAVYSNPGEAFLAKSDLLSAFGPVFLLGVFFGRGAGLGFLPVPVALDTIVCSVNQPKVQDLSNSRI